MSTADTNRTLPLGEGARLVFRVDDHEVVLQCVRPNAAYTVVEYHGLSTVSHESWSTEELARAAARMRAMLIRAEVHNIQI